MRLQYEFGKPTQPDYSITPPHSGITSSDGDALRTADQIRGVDDIKKYDAMVLAGSVGSFIIEGGVKGFYEFVAKNYPELILPVVQFNSLEEFRTGQKNYWGHFSDNNNWGRSRRNMPHYRRFEQSHPKLERKLTMAIGGKIIADADNSLSSIVNAVIEELWQSYALMSSLVFKYDCRAIREDGTPNGWQLIE